MLESEFYFLDRLSFDFFSYSRVELNARMKKKKLEIVFVDVSVIETEIIIVEKLD